MRLINQIMFFNITTGPWEACTLMDRYGRRRIFVALVITLTLITTGCGPQSGPAAGPDPEAEPQPGVGDLPGGMLTVYSGRSESLVGPILQRLTRDTGIEAGVRWGTTSELAVTLLEEGERSPADLFFAQDPGGLGAVAHLFTPLPQEILDRVDQRFRDPNGRWVGLSGRARVVVYNTNALTEADLPTSLEGFTDPAWRGRIGWAPTNASFQTMVTAMRSVWGEDVTRAWLEAMQANEPIGYDGNTPIVAAVGAGEVEVGLVNHYYLYRFLAEEGDSFPARNYFLPDAGPGSLVMVAGIGVLESSTNKEAAFALVEYLLSADAQTYFAEQTNEYPLAAGVEPAADLTPLAELNAIDLPLTELADLEGTVTLLRETGVLP